MLFLVIKIFEWLGNRGGDPKINRILRESRDARARRRERKPSGRPGDDTPESQQ